MGRMEKLSILTCFIVMCLIISGCGSALDPKNKDHSFMNVEQISLKEESIIVNDESKISIQKKDTLVLDQNRINEFLQKKNEQQLQTKFGLFHTTLDAKVEDQTLILDIAFKNVSDLDQRIYFNSGQQFDIFIYDVQNVEVYRWSQDKSFIAAIIEMDVKKDESLTYTEVLDLHDILGEPLPSGTYKVVVKMFAHLASDEQAILSHEDLIANAMIQIEN